MNTIDLYGLLPHRYPYLLVDRIIQMDPLHRVVGIKNVSINEPYFQGHYANNPVMPGTMILEALAQTGYAGLLSDSGMKGRLPLFASLSDVKFRRPVYPGDQLRLEMDILKLRDKAVKMQGRALVEGMVVAEGVFVFGLATQPSGPQIHPTASVHASAILGKDVSIGPNTIIGENVVIGDHTRIEGHVMVERWTRIGANNHIHFGSVIGSAPQDVKYFGEKSWVVIGDHNTIREYVTINRPTGKNEVTKIGSHNLILTSAHVAHNVEMGDYVTVVNQVNIAGHCQIGDRAVIGGMTGIHQFTRIGTGAMVGAYTRLPQDVPPYMLCEGNPATIRTINMVGLRRLGLPRTTLQDIRTIYRVYYQSSKNTTQALAELDSMGIESAEGQLLLAFLKTDSHRGILKRSASDATD
ncbi:acyl-ACP--UDP-N-acetylglucosamine O-acyltransferase [bacterium]|nr:acyl-ACP--UDP-N-acetylglucosamine O-acyltransferase [bacterium]